ncbi:MAG TPA: YciI family protein [Actinomycetes bacterium]|nr:YciI family protein [Actinomycetes bacterium]
MAQYLFLIYSDESTFADATPEDWQLMMKAHRQFADQVAQQGGTIVGGDALESTATATSIRSKSGGSHTVTDGPFAETKEALGGYYLVEAKDLTQAIGFAKLLPVSAGGVEVRPIMDTSGV